MVCLFQRCESLEVFSKQVSRDVWNHVCGCNYGSLLVEGLPEMLRKLIDKAENKGIIHLFVQHVHKSRNKAEQETISIVSMNWYCASLDVALPSIMPF